jgi:hypothetical protein
MILAEARLSLSSIDFGISAPVRADLSLLRDFFQVPVLETKKPDRRVSYRADGCVIAVPCTAVSAC